MSKRPMTVNVAAALEAAQGAAAIGFGLFAGWETAVGAAVDTASAIGVTVLALGGGIGMLACARGLLRAEQWSRSPTVLTQLFALPVAWALWQSQQYAAGLPLGAAAVVTLVAVLSPPSTAWLVEVSRYDDHERQGRDRQAAARGDAGAEETGRPTAEGKTEGESKARAKGARNPGRK